MPSYTDFDRLLSMPRGHAKNDRVHFFKYMPVSTAKIVLKNRTLRWSTPGCLNDPYDMQFDFNLDFKEQEVLPKALDNLWKIYRGEIEPNERTIPRLVAYFGKKTQLSKADFCEQFRPLLLDSIDGMRKNIVQLNSDLKANALTCKILCLTDRPDTASMWNHYADGHKGVVLRFRTVPAFDSAYASAMPVKYVSQVPNLYEDEELVNFMSGLQFLNKDRIFHDLIYTKSLDWQNEREWRVCSGDGRNKSKEPEDICFNKHELDGLVFGRLCSDEDRAALTGLALNYPNVEFFEGKVEGGFGLAIYSL